MNYIPRPLRKPINTASKFLEQALFDSMEPSFLIIGAQKAGTSALFKYLSEHPEIVPAKEKELNFFQCDRRYLKGTSEYLSNFERNNFSNRSKIAFEASPAYLMFAEKTAERIYSFKPDIRLIVSLRDPIERAFSAWKMCTKIHKTNILWHENWQRCCFTDAQLLETRQRPSDFGESFINDMVFELQCMEQNIPIQMPILKTGYYAEQLAFFFRFFKKEQVLIISSESIKKDTPGALGKIERHLGLSAENWKMHDLAPYFEGGYIGEIDKDSRYFLKNIYDAHNEALFSMIQERFEWG